MYTSFVRSVMEFGSLAYMSATDTHLEKLDMIQKSISSSCGFEVESLESRREAAVVSMALRCLMAKQEVISICLSHPSENHSALPMSDVDELES